METTRTLTMRFLGADGKTKSINLTDYKEVLEDNEILEAMNKLIHSGVLKRGGIELISAGSAVKTITTKIPVEF